jgi:hypothetical protein
VLPGHRKISQNRPHKNKFGGVKFKAVKGLKLLKTGREKCIPREKKAF